MPGDVAAPAEAATPTSDEGAPTGAPSWVAAYLAVREREGRLYPDAIVDLLPNVPPGHPLAAEWRQRADSADRLLAHLGRGPGPRRVVDLGSGNGWLAARIASLPQTEVVGIEANDVELAQSRRVFGARPRLRFEAGDLLTAPPPLFAPTAIVLASVTQYVADLPSLLVRLRAWLAPDGEVHVIDSPFYDPHELTSARERTRRYYASLGVPEMAEAYHHHPWSVFDGFGAAVRYRPDAFGARVERRVLSRPRSPFPWIALRRDAR